MSFNPYPQQIIKNVSLATNKTISVNDIATLFISTANSTISLNATSAQFENGFTFFVISNGHFTLSLTDSTGTTTILLTNGHTRWINNMITITVINNNGNKVILVNGYTPAEFNQYINVGIQSGRYGNLDSSGAIITLDISYGSSANYTVNITTLNTGAVASFVSFDPTAPGLIEGKQFKMWSSTSNDVAWVTTPVTQ